MSGTDIDLKLSAMARRIANSTELVLPAKFLAEKACHRKRKIGLMSRIRRIEMMVNNPPHSSADYLESADFSIDSLGGFIGRIRYPDKF